MYFYELVQLLHHNYEEKIRASEFVVLIVDAILDDQAIEKEKEPNPLYQLKKSTLEGYYSGRRKLSRNNAAAIAGRIDEAKFADFVDNLSFDAVNHLRDKLMEFDFEVEFCDVGKACANILAQMIQRRAEGKSDNVVSLNYKRHENGHLLKSIETTSIERRGDQLNICGEIISIHQLLVPENIEKHELAYIHALYETYAEKLNMSEFTDSDVQYLPKGYAENHKEQRRAYYSALSVERSVRDIFDDGENEFNLLKDDAWHGINTTYWKDYEDGYARLNAVLEKITSTTLDRSVLTQIRNLIGNLEKKGICHILVNDGVIRSWVDINGE